MTHSLLQKPKYLLARMLVVAHLAACFLAPWFHQHSGQDHDEANGDFYHAHGSPFASHSPKFEQNYHVLQEVLHLLEGNSPVFDKMQVAISAHFGEMFSSGKRLPHVEFFDLPPTLIYPPQIVVKGTLKLPPLHPIQGYSVLIGTGLSPPLA